MKNTKNIVLCVLSVLCGLGAVAIGRQPVPLTQGMVIDHSVTIRPGTYRIAATSDLKTPAITIRGEGIVVDFNGATLIGSDERADPDQFAGVGVLVDGASKVTIRGGKIRGYKVGILARNSPDLHITSNDLSYNWKQRLYSGIEKESLVDWMSYHQNEKDEWLRYGAAMYLSHCDRAEIDHNTVLQGQNGVMASASTELKIWNNTVQFMSSIGLGLYRVTGSAIMHNRIDWCVRGYSHGFYNRGQDSAGLLMYEQSSNNIVAYNSVTHGGDGLFLWAGQSTMDTGQGGANDNLFYGNDFSHAPTNGIEATFSRNTFANNRVEENWHGVWGGYSYDSVWQGNRFIGNKESIAIEHGQNNRIEANRFERDEVSVRLWQNPTQDPNWGYPKARDTRSRDYRLESNSFHRSKTALQLRDTTNVRLHANVFEDVASRLERTGDTSGFTVDDSDAVVVAQVPAPPRMRGGIDPTISDGERRGRSTIVVDEWGPYDWKSPKLWPVLDRSALLPFTRRAKSDGLFDGPVKLNVLGPPGVWKLVSARGASVTPRSGKVGGVISVTPTGGRVVDYEITLAYTGGEVVSPRGEITPAGKPYEFTYSHFFAPVDWTVNFFGYPATLDPAKEPGALTRALEAKPLATLFHATRIDYLSGGVIEDGIPADHVAFVAEGDVDLPRGDYTIEVISDDGVRLWVDDKVVLNEWEPHESKVDRVDITGGRKRLKLEYYEVAGWAEIRLQIQPRRSRK
jgi:nitrous oxidase accessory protein NosD